MEEKVVLNGEQEAALAAMQSGRNVFLTGEAGAGKSTLLREFIRRSGRNCLVVAPTGIAALNAGGTTIHSQFMLKPGLLDPVKLEPVTDGYRYRVLRMAQTVVVDEISMVRSDLFCAMDARLRELASHEDRHRPFGGRQMILVGDFLQLPPVVGSAEERRFLDERLGGIFAFETDLWHAAQFKTISLKEVHRQSGDSLFRTVLNNIRHGNLDSAAKVINNNCLGEKNFRGAPICLCATNREAKTINERECGKVQGRSRKFTASVSENFPETDFPADVELDLAVGARVMVLCNRRKDGLLECVNGDMGTVIGFGSGDEVSVRLDKGKIITLEPHDWEKYAYSYEMDSVTQKSVLNQEVVGTFRQIPVRLAYAITIHKSQGMSLPAVDLRLGRGCFDHGQLYTALSRCKTIEGLWLDRRVQPEDLIIDESVLKFCQSAEKVTGEDAAGLPRYYEEAMQYYLRRITTGSGELPPEGMKQEEFDFAPRVYSHPVLDKLRHLHEKGMINKYDAPILIPFAGKVIAGEGVKEEELARIVSLVSRY